MALYKPWPYKLLKFKPGDIIVSDGKIGVFRSLGHAPDGGSCNDDSYFFVNAWCWLFDPIDDYVEVDGYMTNLDRDARRARQNERSYLFKKVVENGYKPEYIFYV